MFTSFVRGDLLSRWRQKEHTMMTPWFLLVMMRGKNEPLLNQNGNILVLFSTILVQVLFKESWKAGYPIKDVPNDKHKFHCLPWGRNLSCHHQGLKDVKDHCGKETHKMNLRGWKSQPKIASPYSPTDTPLKNKVLNAEVAVTNFLVQHNLPLENADNLGHFSNLFFLIAKLVNPMTVSDKRQTIINEAFQPYCHNYLVGLLKNNPYSVVKMNQMTRV